MSSQGSSVGKWIAGIIATIISGVVVYHLTEANQSDPPPIVSPRAEPPQSTELNAPPVSAQPIEFRILNELSPIQVSEEVLVYIEGQLVANLVVSQQQSFASSNVRVPRAGNYTYTVLADGIFINQFNQTYRQQGRGDGVIQVNSGSVFTLAATPHGVKLVPR